MDKNNQGFQLDLKPWKRLFLVAAIYNMVGAGICLLTMDFHLGFFYNRVEAATGIILDLYMLNFWIVVFLMGIGYYIVSKNPLQNTGLIFIGGLGKIAAGSIWVYAWFVGWAKLLLVFGALSDIAFGCLFLVFLRKFNVKD